MRVHVQPVYLNELTVSINDGFFLLLHVIDDLVKLI